MGCEYHEKRYKEEGYSDRSAMAEMLLAKLEAQGITINKFPDDMPESSSVIDPAGKTFKINEGCAGCAVLHILHAMAILDPKQESRNIPTRHHMDNRAYQIAKELGLDIDKEEWLHWCAALQGSRKVIAQGSDSDLIWDARPDPVHEISVTFSEHLDDAKIEIDGVCVGLLRLFKFEADVEEDKWVFEGSIVDAAATWENSKIMRKVFRSPRELIELVNANTGHLEKLPTLEGPIS